jgi:hypothetical protein
MKPKRVTWGLPFNELDTGAVEVEQDSDGGKFGEMVEQWFEGAHYVSS